MMQNPTQRARFFDLSNELLAIVTHDGRIADINPAWTTSFGITAADVASRPIVELIHPDDRSDMEAQLNESKVRGSNSYFENRLGGRNGVYRHLAWMVTYLEEEKIFYMFARDVSQFK